jgi:hypothetical protein
MDSDGSLVAAKLWAGEGGTGPSSGSTCVFRPDFARPAIENGRETATKGTRMLAHEYKYMTLKDLFGGEGGIRTRQHALESATYRDDVAAGAINAMLAVAPCT